MKKFYKYTFVVILFTQNVFANWPVFIIPDLNYLLSHNILTSDNCPAGMVRASSIAYCAVGDLCRSYCPETWTWTISGESNCFELSSFVLLNTAINYVNDNNGTTIYSNVTASYGDANTLQTELTLNFITPKENWFCIIQNPELHAITCANDI